MARYYMKGRTMGRKIVFLLVVMMLFSVGCFTGHGDPEPIMEDDDDDFHHPDDDDDDDDNDDNDDDDNDDNNDDDNNNDTSYPPADCQPLIKQMYDDCTYQVEDQSTQDRLTRQQALNACNDPGGDFWDCATGCLEDYGSDDCPGFVDCVNLCPSAYKLIPSSGKKL